ncbi:MAG TPA: menaquinone biosynthesis protein [Bacteroidia bacterium]|nr:menaquinone biosynthesis protein [Bacteroidia bacterium]
MIRISSVNYLNSAPFIYGIRKGDFPEPVTLSLDIPSVCAAKLISGEADIGLVPVASIPLIPHAKIISGFCIGADGPVRSVTLLGDVPPREMKTILLDYQSRTSVALVKLLAKHYWKINPEWKNTSEGFEQLISGNTGGVVIGDRSLRLQTQFKVMVDLGAEWKNMTGLPFVFACWVANRELSPEFIESFESALSAGINTIDKVIAGLGNEYDNIEHVREYLTTSISYNFDEKKKVGLKLFLDYLAELAPVPA